MAVTQLRLFEVVPASAIVAHYSAYFLCAGSAAIFQELVQFETTPKAFANLSPGFERSENPGIPT
jgi:hypothetical protein